MDKFWTDVVNVATAVGTNGAVIVAVVLGIYQGSQAKSDRKMANAEALSKARIVAAGLTATLRHVVNIAQPTLATLVFSHDSMEEQALRLFNALSSARLQQYRPALDVLIPLAALEGCPHRIAKAFDILDSVEKTITTITARGTSFNPVYGPLLTSSVNDLSRAIRYLHDAVRVCEREGWEGAPEPRDDHSAMINESDATN